MPVCLFKTPEKTLAMCRCPADEAARDAELRIGPLKVERKKLYDRLVHIKGSPTPLPLIPQYQYSI